MTEFGKVKKELRKMALQDTARSIAQSVYDEIPYKIIEATQNAPEGFNVTRDEEQQVYILILELLVTRAKTDLVLLRK